MIPTFDTVRDLIICTSREGFYSFEKPSERVRVMDFFMLSPGQIGRFSQKFSEEEREAREVFHSDAKRHNWLIDLAYELGDMVFCDTCRWIVKHEPKPEFPDSEHKYIYINKMFMLQIVSKALGLICTDPHYGVERYSTMTISRLLDSICNKWLLCEVMYNGYNIDGLHYKYTTWTYK